MPHDGVIRVEDLLRSPALQLRLVAGELTRNLDVAAEQTAIERSNAELRRIDSAAGA
ncbi:MAG TPA: hypothetical protein VF256_22610 [Streptosporangiaceae bacterium]|jgi:hypothetical protein